MKKLDKLNDMVGVSVTVRRGKWRVKLGKKVTAGNVIDKLFGTPEEAIIYVESWIKVRHEKSESAKKLSDAEIEDAYACFSILRLHEVDLSMQEIARRYINTLPSKDALTVNELIEKFLNNRDKTGVVGSRHYKQLEYSFNPLCEVFYERLVHELTSHELEDFLDDIYGLKAAKTFNNHLTNLNALLNFGAKKGYLKSNVADSIDRKKTVELAVGVLTPSEIKSLLDIAKVDHPKILIPLALQAFAGLRRSEVMRLTWGDLVGDYVIVGADNSKTGSRRTIPILPPLKALLEDFAGMAQDKKIYTSTVRMLHEWRVKCSEKAGIAWKHNCLRHSFVTYRLIDKKDANLVALEAGHTATILHKHYKALISNEDAVATAFWGLYFAENITSIKSS